MSENPPSPTVEVQPPPDPVNVPLARPVRRKWGFMWWLGVLSLLIFLYRSFVAVIPSKDLAYLVGQSLGQALVFLLLFYLLVLRRRYASPAGWLSLLVLWGSFFGGNLCGVQRLKNDRKALQNDMVAYLDQWTDPHATTRPGMVGAAPRASGEIGEMQRWFREIAEGAADLRRQYLAELEAIGWDRILDAQRILHDRRFQDSREIIRQAKVIVGKYRKRHLDYMQQSIDGIDRLNLNPRTKADMRRGADAQMPQTLKFVEEQWKSEELTLNEFEAIIDLLAEHKEAWKVEDDNILFFDKAILKEYRQHQSRINTITDKEEQSVKDKIQTIKEKVKILD